MNLPFFVGLFLDVKALKERSISIDLVGQFLVGLFYRCFGYGVVVKSFKFEAY